MWDLRQIGLRKGNDSSSGNLVHRERRARSWIDDRTHAGEVSHSHRVGGKRGGDRDSLEDAASLIVAKKESSVLLDRSAQAGPELVLAEVRLRGIEEVSGVQDIVPKKFVNNTVEGIRN